MSRNPERTATNTKPKFVALAPDLKAVMDFFDLFANRFSEGALASESAGRALSLLLSFLRRWLVGENELPCNGELSEAIMNLTKIQPSEATIYSREGFDHFIADNTKSAEATKNPIVLERITRGLGALPEKERNELIAAAGANSPASARTLAALAGFDFPNLAESVRPLRVAVWSMLLYEEDARTIIGRAQTGDRGATLQLVRIDPLFLHDVCTVGVFKNAELHSDTRFFAQLRTALKYKPTATDKQFCGLAIFLLLTLGFDLQKVNAFQHLFDPDGVIFPGTYAFPRYVQRVKRKFETITASKNAPLEPGNCD